MKVSEQWLREWVNPSVTIEDIAARLTMAGLEVESVNPVAANFSGVVVGEVLSLAPHPDADKLRVCQVRGHPDGVLQVVCGASNVRIGLKIPFALVGARLPAKEGFGDVITIQAAKLRGVASNGMLCSARELGMESANDGLLELPVDAPVGCDVREYLQLDDNAIEINVTPNRGDCLSVRGLAREIAVLTDCAAQAPTIGAVAAQIPDTLTVQLAEPSACPRYAGRLLRGIDNTVATPLWMQEKLRRSGLRSINAVVDVTNTVLLELGQPMHAFDHAKLSGNITVRHSRSGEMLELLNDQTIALKEQSLVIADDAQVLALAGIMGGRASSVSSGTSDIFLEAAFFDPLAMAGKARRHGLHTDSSQRFERGVDFGLPVFAIERATALLMSIVGGKPGPITVQEQVQHLPVLPAITLHLSRTEQYLGLSLAANEVAALLRKLDMTVAETNAEYLVVRAPSWRHDVRIEVDLLEEIARIHGYNNLPSRQFKVPLELKPVAETALSPDAIKSRLQTLGYREVITYSFVDPGLQEILDSGADPRSTVKVQNPISADMGVMRNSLLPGLIATARYNLNHQQTRIRIFETGLVYTRNENGYGQVPMLGLLASGQRNSTNWFNKNSQLFDIYDIKGDIEAVLSMMGGEQASFVPGHHPVLHPGQSASITRDGKVLGWLGALHPALLDKVGLDQPVYVAQLSLDAISTAVLPAFEEVSRFPEVRRDLAFLVKRGIPVQDLIEKARAVADSCLTNLKVFDVYSGEHIDPERKSIALGLTFQAKTRTLTDNEIDENVSKVIQAICSCFGAELRG